MLICLKCNIEYEDGIKFCSSCGSPLVTQGRPVSNDDEKNKSKEGKPDEKLICPNCKLLYEKMTLCIRCGATLVKEIPSKQKEEPLTLEVEKEKVSAATSPEVKKEPLEPVYSTDFKKEPSPAQTPVKHTVQKKPEDTQKETSPSLKSKKKFPRQLLEVLSVSVLIAIGIFSLWSIYSHFTTKQSGPSTPSPKETPSLILHSTSSSTSDTPILVEPQEGEKKPPAQSVPINEPEEIEEIKSLLEKIRQANLQKNIDLFMSCYSTDFKERESKKKATLETWDNFNYLDLSYTLEDYSKSGLAAQAKVEWLIKFYLKEGSQTKENKSTLNVRFKKEDGSWKIKETKPAS